MALCPQCAAVGAQTQFSGLGGQWKVICSSCGYRYDDSERTPAEPATDEAEE